MDTETIFQAVLATTAGLRTALVQVTVERDAEWGDTYLAELLEAGSPAEELYKGEDLAQAQILVQEAVEDRERFARQSATSAAGILISEIVPTRVTVNLAH